MGGRLPTELMTIRAGDVRSTDLVELPELVYVWRASGTKGGIGVDPRWTGQTTAHDSRLKSPTWHFVYDMFTTEDDLSQHACDLGMELALQALYEEYVVLRFGAAHPNDAEREIRFAALHEEELVRVRRLQLQDDIDEQARVITRLDVERPFIVEGPDGEIVDRFASADAAADFLHGVGRDDPSVARGEWSITNMIDPDAPPYRVVD